MRPDSRLHRCRDDHRPRTLRLVPAACAVQICRAAQGTNRWLASIGEMLYRSLIMKWETPAAAEIRFGFEITMYVANR
ncbi:MAG TPA: pyrroloquinoline quinone precursor peptide PqqA [Burkholderiaceae bacterium]